MLHAMGIPYKCVCGIYIYEIAVIYLKSIVIELLISFAGIYLLYKQMVKQIGYYVFEIPFMYILFPNIISGFILIVMILVMIKKSNIRNSIDILNG